MNATNPAHTLDWEQARLLWPSENYNDRRIVEASFISARPNFNTISSTISVDRSSADIILKTIPRFGSAP